MTKTYFSYNCGFACIREMGTDSILATLKGKRSIDQHLATARTVAKKNGWIIQ